MRHTARNAGLVALIVILGLAAGFSLWPHALTNAAFGVNLSPTAGSGSGPGPWVATALVRIAGLVVALLAAMIMAAWTRTATSRRVFVGVGGVSVLLAMGQWKGILPFAVGVGATALIASLVLLGWVALAQIEATAVQD